MKQIAIIGGGPSGSALATFLLERGHGVTIFDDGKRPELLVGESLIPALVPVLRKLGLEEQVAAISQYKPGVTFIKRDGQTITFGFDSVGKCSLPTYAYNAPRPALDRLLAQRATDAGATRLPLRAKLEKTGENRLGLAPESLAAAPALQNRQPDLLVDATGRARLFARTLGIPAMEGPRKDVAYFAHFEGCEKQQPDGQVFISFLEEGWSWRIPLRDCLSIGIVIHREAAARLGATAEERLDAAIRRDPALAAVTKNARRCSEVATYANYQLRSERGFGPGWVMTGDAYGFVDPMLSPGMWLALRSAEILSENLDKLPVYAAQMDRLLTCWSDLIENFYNGKMMAAHETGLEMARKHDVPVSRWINKYIETHIARMASGATTTSTYARTLLSFLLNHGIRRADYSDLAVH